MGQSLVSVKKALTSSPIHVAADSLSGIRNRIKNLVDIYSDTTLLMPVTKDLVPFWVADCKGGWFNTPSFPGYAVMHSVIRDYHQDFIKMVDGTIVESEKVHDGLLTEFNKLYVKAISGKGQGYPKGTLSEDQFIRMGCLFYIILKTSDMSLSIKTNELGLLSQPWIGVGKVVNVNTQQLAAYSDKLGSAYFANCSWDQFVFRAMHEDYEHALWLFDLTGADFGADSVTNIGLEDLIKIFDIIPLFAKRGHDFCIVLDNTDENIQILQYLYDFVGTDDGIYFSGDLILDTSYMGRKYMVLNRVREV